jgi:hypothetical protein
VEDPLARCGQALTSHPVPKGHTGLYLLSALVALVWRARQDVLLARVAGGGRRLVSKMWRPGLHDPQAPAAHSMRPEALLQEHNKTFVPS